MKWKSVLFSELLNKLGDQIVGTKWKGRGVFRAYKKPANPNTLAQQAGRQHHTQVLQLYQENVGGDETKQAMWNDDALPRRIAGVNLFMKLGRSNVLAVPGSEAYPTPITVTYTIKTDLSTAGIFVLKPDETTFAQVVQVGLCEAGEDQTADYSPAENGLHYFYLVDGRSKTIPPTDADRSSLYNHWKPNLITGISGPAICSYSGVS